MTFLYTGAYTEPPMGRAQGIGIYHYDDGAGTLDLVQAVTGISNPTFLTASADGRYLYAAGEGQNGAVAAFSRDPETGGLTELNRQPSGGNGPCYVSIDASGRYVLVANYGSGSLGALPIAGDGSLGEATSVVQHEGSGPNTDRQDGPHAHMIAPTPDGRFVLATDLGTDEVLTYTLDPESGQLQRVGSSRFEPGAGPRHFAFSPDGKTAYVINELDSTLAVCDYDGETGTLSPRQTLSAVPEGYDEETYCAHVIATDDGRFVYGSNRGHDSIAAWEVDARTGELTTIGHISTEGSFPRNFTLDPSGTRLLVANQKSDNLAMLSRDPNTGLLSKETVLDGIPSTVCLLFV